MVALASCARRTATPAGCASDADCSAPNRRCEPATGACVACLDDGDCSDGQLCARPANVCAERCVGSESCGDERPVCVLETGLCVACGPGAACPFDVPHCLASGRCAECVEHTDCAELGDDDDDDGEQLFCNPDGRCVECLADGDCDDVGEQCSARLGSCARPCSAAAPCGGDEPICDVDIGYCVECRTDLDCEDGEPCRSSECVD